VEGKIIEKEIAGTPRWINIKQIYFGIIKGSSVKMGLERKGKEREKRGGVR